MCVHVCACAYMCLCIYNCVFIGICMRLYVYMWVYYNVISIILYIHKLIFNVHFSFI